MLDWTAIASSFAQGITNGGAAPTAANALSSSPFDSSGLQINFGTGSIESARNAGGSELSQFLPFVAVAAALLVAYRLTRRKKG